MRMPSNWIDETTTCASARFFHVAVVLLRLGMVTSARDRNHTSNHGCYTCVEPLIGYSKSDRVRLE